MNVTSFYNDSLVDTQLEDQYFVDCMSEKAIYNVNRLKEPIEIDSIWEKPQWQDVEAVGINQFLWTSPAFQPFTQLKMRYDDQHLYTIFRVQDRFVRCLVQDYNGPVYNDSCVELFFSPDVRSPERYFNLEVNCTGIPLMHYNIIPRKDRRVIDVDDIRNIKIAHSLPLKKYLDIADDITWTLEYKIPFSMLEKYSDVTRPQKGIVWNANFYKIAEKGINPHFAAWSQIDTNEPDFHLPEFFGKLKFN